MCGNKASTSAYFQQNISPQGMVALGALSYLLQQDGQKSLADHYDQTNKNFITYFLEHAKVSDYILLSLVYKTITVRYHPTISCRLRVMIITICSMTYPIQHGH